MSQLWNNHLCPGFLEERCKLLLCVFSCHPLFKAATLLILSKHKTNHIIPLVQPPPWLPISLKEKSEVFTMAVEASKMLYLISFLGSSPTPPQLLLQPHWIPCSPLNTCVPALSPLDCYSLMYLWGSLLHFLLVFVLWKANMIKKKSKQKNINHTTLNLYYSSSTHHPLKCCESVYLIIYCLSLPVRLRAMSVWTCLFTAVSWLSEQSLAYGTCSGNTYGINGYDLFNQNL